MRNGPGPTIRHAQRFWIFLRGSGPPEKVFNELWKPSRGRLGARRGRKLLDDHKAVDLSLQVGVEEGRVVAEGHASVRLAVGTEHVGMCKQPITAEHFAVADWNRRMARTPWKGSSRITSL